MANPENIVEHQFKPGESGNPSGRPKGITSITTTLKKLMNAKYYKKVKNPITKEDTRNKGADILAFELFKKASKGDLKALEIILDRMDGKVKDHTVLGFDDNNIKVNLNVSYVSNKEDKDA